MRFIREGLGHLRQRAEMTSNLQSESLGSQNEFRHCRNAYKPSRFNAHVPAPDGSLVLFNSRSGHTCVVPSKGVARAKLYLSRSGFCGELDGLGRYFLNGGYIVPQSVDEDMVMDVAYANQHYRPDQLYLVLLASEECNFRCFYCSQPFKHGTMEPQVRAGIRKLIESRIEKLTHLSIAWFGGEPLLGYEAIAELAPFFQEATRANCVSYDTGITTNGYLMTPELVGEMLGWGILKYQVTVDGLPEDHNRSRPLKDGGPTFSQIMDNLTQMRRFDASFEVRLRVNFDRDNVQTLNEFFEYVVQRLGGDNRFLIAFNPVDKWGGPNDDRLQVFTDDVLVWQSTLRENAVRFGLPIESALARARGNFGCFATRAGGLLIGADGRLLKCTNYGAFPPDLNSVGTLLDNGTLSVEQDKLLRWILPYYNYDPMCKKCSYLPVCGGGIICPAARVRGIKPECPQERYHIQSLLLEHWRERQSATNRTVRVNICR